jgi:hypothetical protein
MSAVRVERRVYLYLCQCEVKQREVVFRAHTPVRHTTGGRGEAKRVCVCICMFVYVCVCVGCVLGVCVCAGWTKDINIFKYKKTALHCEGGRKEEQTLKIIGDKIIAFQFFSFSRWDWKENWYKEKECKTPPHSQIGSFFFILCTSSMWCMQICTNVLRIHWMCVADVCI